MLIQSPSGKPPEGLYAATLAEPDPVDNSNLPYAPAQAVRLPLRIVLQTTESGGATITMQFPSNENLERFRSLMTDKRLVLDISGERLDFQNLKYR
jgi:hypothetical protein